MQRAAVVYRILPLLLALCTTGTAQAHHDKTASGGAVAPSLIGTWQLQKATHPGRPSGIGTRLKLFTDTHWTVIQPDPVSGQILFQHGGHYTFDGKVLQETVDFAGDATSALIGRTFSNPIHLSQDQMEQTDPNGVFTETWQRLETPATP